MSRARLTFFLLTMWLVPLGLQGCSTLGHDSRQAQEDPKPRQVQASFLSVPLSFEANQGQTDSEVKLLSRGPGYGLFLTPSEAVLALNKGKSTQAEAAQDGMPSESAVLRMRLVGANPTPELSGETVLPGKVHYFKGNDPKKWRTNVPTYGKARYANVYPGIDLVYYGNQQQLEFDFVVAPGQDPKTITMRFQGADQLELEANTGDLVLQTPSGVIRQHKPVIYQEVAGARQPIEGRYLIKTPDQVGFQVAAYDSTKPLIIDPILVFSTYLGGSEFDDGLGIAVDEAGQILVTGRTLSTDFPIQNALQPALASTPGDTPDAFVTRLTADGSALVYSTYLGGSGTDEGWDIVVDGAGQASVTGWTCSTDFPTQNAVQPALSGSCDAFVTRLTADGSALVYSTYLGGSAEDEGAAIAVDGAGQISVTGNTWSADFPTQNAVQPVFGGGVTDAFVTQLTADGSALVYSTYLGGSDSDSGSDIAVDGAGQALVTGRTVSTDFPTQNAFQSANGGGEDAFVTRLTADGSARVYSTYLGGSGTERGAGIALDGAGQAAVTGLTTSTDFPTMNALQPILAGGGDAFVAQLTADGAALNFSTYLGGEASDQGEGIAVDGAGQVSVTGQTWSNGFPTTANAFQPSLAGFNDAFVTQLTADGSALVYATYLGGSGEDQGEGIAVDGAGQAHVIGATTSLDFPTVNPFQPAYGGTWDGFVAKIDPLRENLNDKLAPLGPGDVSTVFSAAPCGGASAGTFTITATFTNISTDTLANLLLTVQSLTGGNVLCNANGGPGGTGSQLTVPLVGDLADGQLSPGEAFVVELPVGLQSFNPFTFVVDVLGEEAP